MNWTSKQPWLRRALALVMVILLVAQAVTAQGGAVAVAEVELLSSSAFLSAGSIYVVGEVQNTGSASVALVRAVATFRDAASAVLGTAYSFVLHDTLAPGQVSPFVIERTLPIGYASYELALDWAPSITGPIPELTFAPVRQYVDGFGFLTWVGEVTNTTGFAVASPEIIVTLYDAAGNVRNVEHAPLFHDVLAPGQKGPFQVVLFNGPADYATRSFTSNSRLATTTPPTLRSSAVQQSVGPGGGPRFTGQIQNLGSSRVSRVRAVVTLFDVTGLVVNASYGWTDPLNLEPGEKAPFEVTFPEAYQGWSSYRLDPPSQAPTATPTATRTRTATPSPTATQAGPTATVTATATVTPTATATVTQPRWSSYLPIILLRAER